MEELIEEVEEEKGVRLTPTQKQELKKELKEKFPLIKLPQIEVSKLKEASKNVVGATINVFKAVSKAVSQGVYRLSTEPVLKGTSKIAQVFKKPGGPVPGLGRLARGIEIGIKSFIAIVFDRESTKIIGVQLVVNGSQTASLSFTTNHPGTAKINYGTSTEYGQEKFSDQHCPG